MLRNIILVLVLANLLLFAWQQWIDGPDRAQQARSGEDSGEQLVLLDRAEFRLRQARGSPADASSGTEPPATDPREPECMRIGPFASDRAADAVEQQLAGRGLTFSRETEEGSVWVGHWVQLAELPNRAAAEAAVSRLASVGIQDSYIFSSSPGFTVSLGIFRNPVTADETVEIARRAGFRPSITDRFRDGAEHWLNVDLGGRKAPDLGQIRLAGAHILRTVRIPCVKSPSEEQLDGTF